MTLSIQVPADIIAIAKARAADPTKVAEYERIVLGLAADIKKAAATGEAAMFDKAQKALAAEWSKMTAAQRDRVLARVGTIIERQYVTMHATTASMLEQYGTQVAQGTRRVFKKKIDPNISASLTSKDRTFINRVAKSRAWYIKSHGQVLGEAYQEVARSELLAGAYEGLSDKQVAKELATLMNTKTIQRSEAYYRVVANAAMNRSRNWAALQSYNEAGISQVRFTATLDESTSDQCRWLHGKVWKVKDTIGMLDRAEERAVDNPESVKETTPWITTIKDEKTGEQFLAFKKGESHVRLAQVNRSAVGERDKIGDYKAIASDKELEEYGVITPPAHGNCRSLLEPVM